MLLLLGFKCGSLFKIFRLNLTVLVLRQCRKKLKGFSSNDEVTRRLRKHDGQGPPNRHHTKSGGSHQDVPNTNRAEVRIELRNRGIVYY
jgi:hypothetical protein